MATPVYKLQEHLQPDVFATDWVMVLWEQYSKARKWQQKPRSLPQDLEHPVIQKNSGVSAAEGRWLTAGLV